MFYISYHIIINEVQTYRGSIYAGKIGQSIIASSPNSKISKNVLTKRWMKNDITSREKVLKVLQTTEKALNIHQIARKAKISWYTAKTALHELMLLEKVYCLGRSEKGRGKPLLFRLKCEKKE